MQTVDVYGNQAVVVPRGGKGGGGSLQQPRLHHVCSDEF